MGMTAKSVEAAKAKTKDTDYLRALGYLDVSIEVNDQCNFHCVYCPYDTDPNHEMSVLDQEKVKELIDRLADDHALEVRQQILRTPGAPGLFQPSQALGEEPVEIAGMGRRRRSVSCYLCCMFARAPAKDLGASEHRAPQAICALPAGGLVQQHARLDPPRLTGCRVDLEVLDERRSDRKIPRFGPVEGDLLEPR